MGKRWPIRRHRQGRKDAHTWGRDYSGQAARERGNRGDMQGHGYQEQGPRQQGDPWNRHGEEGTQGLSPEDPWCRWKHTKEQKLKGDQQQNWRDQQGEARAGRAETPAPMLQWDRINPWREEGWKAGMHHREMRYGNWK